MIEARQLTKLFRDRRHTSLRAVDNVQFRCEPGEIYGLLGANGAGKTTTLRMLATLLKPSSGTASVAGHDIIREPDRVRARVGFISSGTALYGRLTARETAEYFGRLYGVGEDALRRRIQELFSRLEMGGFENRRCDKLSTGMKQKVSVVRTLIHDPPVMIFDEPTLGLDVMTAPEPLLPMPVRAAFTYKKKSGRREYVRVTLRRATDGSMEAIKFPREGAGLLSSLVETDGLAELGESVVKVKPGDSVGFLGYASLL